MTLTKEEMHVMCALHSGTLSATLEVLHGVAESDSLPPEKKEAYRVLADKLSSLKDGEAVSLAFDPE